MLGLTSNGKCQAHMVRNRTPWFRSWGALAERVRKKNKNKKNISDITPDPGGHRPQRPCAQGRTCAEQE